MSGKYKNAPNQFTETGFTAPHREQMEALVDSLFEQLRRRHRGGPRPSRRSSARPSSTSGPFDAPAALAAGLVDELLYRDEVEERIPAPNG